jgi:hypothetical protein
VSLVLIEGIDRSGKSTLAGRLAQELDAAAVMHFSAPKAGALEEYVRPLLAYRPRRGATVLDRGHIGEAVWPEFFGREPRMDALERKWIELFMMSRGAVYVHADRDTPGLERAWAEAEEAGEPEPLDAGLIEAARVRYIEEMRDAGPPIVGYTHDRLDELAPLIAETARNQAGFAEPGLRISDEWIGNHRPAALLVARGAADVVHVPRPGDAPFAELMAVAGGRWRECAVCAAPRRARDLRDLWSYLGQPVVVWAGEDAEAAVFAADLPRDDDVPF